MTTPLYDKGIAVRRKVLGERHVANSLKNMDAFSGPLTELATEYCWGSVWGRDGLPHRTRSLVNLGMLVALNRANEFKLHVRGALNNGCTKQEIQEVLLQTAIYCGIPAGSEAFRNAKQVFAELEAERAAEEQNAGQAADAKGRP